MNGQPDFDAATARALDRLTVPPLSPGFADRIVAAASTRTAADALPMPVAPRGAARRGAWARGRRVLIGVAAFGLMSAGAAATGVFGDVAKNVPVIGPLIASVAPKPKPVAVAKPKLAKVAKPVPPPVAVAPPVEPAAPSPETVTSPRERRALRREFVAQRLVDRIERREALGLELTPAERARFAERLAKLPPRQRLALIKRVREIRRERNADLPPAEMTSPPPRAIPLLTPEQRQQLREDRIRRREAWRLRRLEAEEGDPNSPASSQ